MADFLCKSSEGLGSVQPSLDSVVELVMQHMDAMERDYYLAEAILTDCIGTSGSHMGAADWTGV